MMLVGRIFLFSSPGGVFGMLDAWEATAVKGG